MSNDGPSPERGERWAADAGSAAIGELQIPADLRRERVFEISCAMTVRANASANSPWHELRVYADGELQWSRRIPTQHPAPFDGLEMRFRRRVAVGRALRVQARADCAEGRRLSLLIEAEQC